MLLSCLSKNSTGFIFCSLLLVILYSFIYRNAYNLVLYKYGDMLYDGVRDTIHKHLESTAYDVTTTHNDSLLVAISRSWSDHTITVNMIKDILMYMDRTYVLANKKVTVYVLGLQLFRSTIIHHDQVRDRMRKILLENILKERSGCLIDRDVMKSVLSMLVELGVVGINTYEEDFECYFLEETRRFYHDESQIYLSQCNCPDYIHKAETRLQEEMKRVTSYLSPGTEPKLKHIVETELITNHAKSLIDMEHSGCINMMSENKLGELKHMYNLFSRVPSTLDLLRDAMCDYAKECGFAILTEQDREKDQVKFVQQLLDLKVKFDDIVNESFGGEKKAHKKLREAFEEFINKDTRCASYLSLYIDELLKAGLRGLSESDAETQLDRVISIFRFLQDKDIFEVFYRTQLSKRLLNGRTSSDEYERTMVAKLKAECGYQFTAKLEGMFTDMKISKTAMETFKVSESFRKLEIELDVCVLTTGYWPINAPTLCNLPGVMQDAIDKFSEYYLVSYNGRKLTWLPNLGTVDIKAMFACGMRELTVSTYQACILMLFNDPQVATLTLDQIRNSSQIPEADLKRHLLSLCTPKFKILVKSSKSRVS